MTPAQFRAALIKLGLTQGQAAYLLDVSIRTINGYANDQYPVPRSVALLFRLMLEYGIIPEELK